MSDEGQSGERGGLPEALRTAVGRTLDEVTRRGVEAREEVSRRAGSTREGLSRIRFASTEELDEVSERVAELETRLEALETALRTQGMTGSNPRPKG